MSQNATAARRPSPYTGRIFGFCGESLHVVVGKVAHGDGIRWCGDRWMPSYPSLLIKCNLFVLTPLLVVLYAGVNLSPGLTLRAVYSVCTMPYVLPVLCCRHGLQ